MQTHTQRIKVWDLPVRVFHWSLVTCFAGAWLTSDDAEALHHWFGYGALGLIAFRLLWGLIGSYHARFANFVPRPGTLAGYVQLMTRRREPRYLGHNPAAAMMILFLIGMVTLIGTTGWLMTTDWGWGSDVLETVHEGAAQLTLAAVAVHVTAAIYESLHHRENLIAAMVTGVKRQ